MIIPITLIIACFSSSEIVKVTPISYEEYSYFASLHKPMPKQIRNRVEKIEYIRRIILDHIVDEKIATCLRIHNLPPDVTRLKLLQTFHKFNPVRASHGHISRLRPDAPLFGFLEFPDHITAKHALSFLKSEEVTMVREKNNARFKLVGEFASRPTPPEVPLGTYGVWTFP